MDHNDSLLGIGTFSRLTSISIRMLRHYQDRGVLIPAFVSPHNGRRFYDADQLAQANLIVMLRDAGFPVEAISRVLATSADPSMLTSELDRHHGLLTEKTSAVHTQLAHLQRLRAHLKGHPDMTDVTIQHLPSMTVASLRRVIPAYNDEGKLWEEIMGLLHQSDAAFPASGLSGASFHDPDYHDSDVDVEVWIQVTGPFTPPEGLVCREMVAVDMVTATLHGDYSQYPAVTEKIGQFIAAEQLTTGPMFNIYHVSAAQNPDPATWVTQLCFPIVKNPTN